MADEQRPATDRPPDRFDALARAIAAAPDVDVLDELWTVARREFAGRLLEVLEQMIDARALQITDPALDPGDPPPVQDEPRP